MDFSFSLQEIVYCVLYKRMSAPAINNSLCCIDRYCIALFIAHVNIPNCFCAKTTAQQRIKVCMCSECKQDGHQRHLSDYIESSNVTAPQNKVNSSQQSFTQNNHYFRASGDLLSEDNIVHFWLKGLKVHGLFFYINNILILLLDVIFWLATEVNSNYIFINI